MIPQMQCRKTAIAAVLLAGSCDSTRMPGPNEPGNGEDAGRISVDAGMPDGASDAGPNEPSVADAGRASDGGEPAAIDAGTACATPPIPTYFGEQFEQHSGSGSYIRNRVEVTWTLGSTEGCIDRYTPSGLVFDEDAGPCSPTFDPASGAIDPGDGELVIDRSTSPATYTVHGESFYQTTMTGDPECDQDPTPHLVTVGGAWANQSGGFDGALIAGVAYTHTPTRSWYLVASGTVFTPPTDGCSEAATDHWTSAHHDGPHSATVMWTRTSTQGCLDRYEPAGTAVGTPPLGSEGCTFGSLSHAIEPGDGWLEIDRSADPAVLSLRGHSSWTTTASCTNNRGEPYTYEAGIASWWGEPLEFGMSFDGNRWSGAYATDYGDIDWTFSRVD